MSKNICLVLPSLTSGGMERVMSEIANFLANNKKVQVYLILLTQKDKFYKINEKVKIIEPSFSTSSDIYSKIKILHYLRKNLIKIKPYSLLSFGSMYNSFVMISSLGLKIRIFLSDRSNPYRNSRLSFKKDEINRHDGIAHFFLKRIFYRLADGIIVQTDIAKDIEEKTLKHKNIIVLPNPIRNINSNNRVPEKIVLNVGRFIKLKQQIKLIESFAKVRVDGWKLIFLGDGPELVKAKQVVNELNLSRVILFKGNVSNIDNYYSKSEIFAFMSSSEGFPNALGEALKTPLASIAFDCVAGPSDLIKDNFNGYLVPLNNYDLFSQKLKNLMEQKEIRDRFNQNSLEFMKNFDYNKIMRKIENILTS